MILCSSLDAHVVSGVYVHKDLMNPSVFIASGCHHYFWRMIFIYFFPRFGGKKSKTQMDWVNYNIVLFFCGKPTSVPFVRRRFNISTLVSRHILTTLFLISDYLLCSDHGTITSQKNCFTIVPWPKMVHLL